MQKIGALLLLILFIILFIFLVWEDDTSKDTSLPVENTTDIFTEDKEGQEDARFKLKKRKEGIKIKHTPTTFTLTDTKELNHTVTLSDQNIVFDADQKPIVLINLFATWCIPCIGEIPYLNDLQKKYQKELFVAGIVTHDSVEKSALNSFTAKHQISYFISKSTDNDAFSALLASILELPENFSIPLTVIYVNGEYFTHYEGSVPVEMIEYDIQQAKKQLNTRE